MGCLKSKPVAELPKNALSLVETVYGGKTNDKLENGKFNSQRRSANDLSKKGKNMSDKSSPGGQINKYKEILSSRVLAKYELKALIGKGAHSRVLRVENRATKQPYALKVVYKPRAAGMWETELNVLSRVNHPYIIHLIEALESDDRLYVVVELATGGELFERIISRVCFPELDAIKTLKMILEGTAYLHSLGIAHRDLKPENLLYYHPGADSKLMITDFGLSGCSKEGFMNTACGTPEYIAPEVLAKQPYTCQVDMWAVGVIAYILLSGNLPFDDDNRGRLYRSIIKGKYTYDQEHWRDISQSARDFVDSLLVVDPTKRLTAQQALRHSWLVDPPCSGSSSASGSKDNNTCSNQQTSSSSATSSRSGRSVRSFKSEKRHRKRVCAEEIEQLHKDPEVRAELSSLASWGKSIASDR